jgi:Ni/Co efflux regulator RcnB
MALNDSTRVGKEHERERAREVNSTKSYTMHKKNWMNSQRVLHKYVYNQVRISNIFNYILTHLQNGCDLEYNV